MFIDKLIKKITTLQNPTVIGLDPDISQFPDNLKNLDIQEALESFNFSIIDKVCDIIPAVKLQSAYYEMYGLEGITAFKNTIDYAKSKGMIVIADVKRNDIGSTAKAYSKAYLGKAFDVDCITVNPYLGSDGIVPFLEDCKEYNKGLFILAKTSNPSSGEFQNITTADGKPVYVHVAEKIATWGSELIGEHGYSSIGAVVGATYPEEIKVLREKMKHVFFLIPGYGAQGGKAEDIRLALDNNNLGALINSSRGLMYAYKSNLWKDKFKSEEFANATRAEAIKMKDELWR